VSLMASIVTQAAPLIWPQTAGSPALKIVFLISVGILFFSVIMFFGSIVEETKKSSVPESRTIPNVNINNSPSINQNAFQEIKYPNIPEDNTPNLVPVNFSADFIHNLGSGSPVFVISFLNDVITSSAAAEQVKASIKYSRDEEKMFVEYGVWTDRMFPEILIGRGDTKNLIVALKDGDDYFAVSDMAPATWGTDSRVQSRGKLTCGDWKLSVILTAERFRKEYRFIFTVTDDGKAGLRQT